MEFIYFYCMGVIWTVIVITCMLFVDDVLTFILVRKVPGSMNYFRFCWRVVFWRELNFRTVGVIKTGFAWPLSVPAIATGWLSGRSGKQWLENIDRLKRSIEKAQKYKETVE